MASPVGSPLEATGLADAEGAGVAVVEGGTGDADGLAGGFDWQAETIRTAIRASEATAGRRPRPRSVRWDMGRIVARRCRGLVSARPDVAFLIGWLLDPQSAALSVSNGRTRNGSIPPSLETGGADWAGAPGLSLCRG